MRRHLWEDVGADAGLSGRSGRLDAGKSMSAMAEGRDDIGISREKDDRSMVSLVIYPGVYNSFNAPILRSVTPGRDLWAIGLSTMPTLKMIR
jgi:hypothetical protein